MKKKLQGELKMTLYKTSRIKSSPEIIVEKTSDKIIKCRICGKDIDETTMIEGCERKDCPFADRKQNND